MLRSIPVDGAPGLTARYTSTDVAQTLPAAVVTVAGKIAVGLDLTVEDNPVRIAFGGAVPSQGATPLGHLMLAGTSIRVYGSQVISTFRYISANAVTPGILQITVYYTP